ncbi:MAG: methylmalonyl Co-A mutase-associated GTPase MeaB [Acidobacteria bacterium]|nr:methylmalonyl Co-A mutase-associated GTPase MeaB [Acidobacteriota bacterium]
MTRPDDKTAGATSAALPAPRRRELSAAEIVDGVLRRDRAVVARALTLVESSLPRHRALAEDVLASLLPHAGGSIRVGVSGPPGAGKSTFIESLGRLLLGQGRRVAVLAVDPSSEVSGGSLLGDKTRMAELARSERALVRPSPAGLHLGGVAPRTREAILVCEAAGFDVTLVETVGVGQSETQVASMVDFFLLLTIAGAGDELQGLKRGVLELVDAVAVNKADGDGEARARVARDELESALRLLRPEADGRRPTVHVCSAVTGAGVAAIWDTIVARREALQAGGRLEELRRRQSVRWFEQSVDLLLKERFLALPGAAALRAELEEQVAAGRLSPAAAARRIVGTLVP